MRIERRGLPQFLAALVFGLLAGCGGGSSSAPPPTGPDDPLVDDEQVSPGDKLAQCQQRLAEVQEVNQTAWDRVVAAGPPQTLEQMGEAACQVYCGRTTECAVDSACATVRDGQGDEVVLEDFAPKNTDRHTQVCLDACNSWKMTKQQIGILGNCSQADTDCASFRSCSDEAMPK